MTAPTIERPRFDLDDIRTRHPLLATVAADVALKEASGYHFGPCPFCGEGTDRFTVFHNPHGDYYNCRKCGKRGGDAIQYTQDRRGWDFVTAAKYLDGSPAPEPIERPLAASRPELDGKQWGQYMVRLETLAGRAITCLMGGECDGAELAWEWLRGRGIYQEQIAWFGLGWNDQWREIIPGYKLPPGLVIPRWPATAAICGALVYLDGETRRRYGQKKMMAAGSCAKRFWNGFRLPDPDVQTVIITEGELDAVLLSRFLSPIALPVTLGGAMTLPEPDELAHLDGRRVLLAFDNDQAGRDGVDRWRGILPSAEVMALPQEWKDITEGWRQVGDQGVAEWVQGVTA